MTTAESRAVPFVVANLRAALMATASMGLLVALTPAASAASCATTTGNNTCVISLVNANLADNHDGQAGDDTLEFGISPGPESLTFTNLAFTTANTAQFQNFENAIVRNGTTLILNDGDNLDASRNLIWTIDSGGILRLNSASTATGDANDIIGNGSAVTVAAGGLLEVYENERIGALSGAGTVDLIGGTFTVGGAENTFSGLISGAGNLSVLAAGKWILTGNNSYTGATTVLGGTLEIQNAGAIDNSSSVTINGGEITSKSVANYNLNNLTITAGRLTGNATINGDVSSNGGLQPGNTSVPPGDTRENPGQDMGTINVTGNYASTGTNAYVGMFINIDAAAPAGGTPGTTHDFLNIDGNVTGTTTFAVASFLSTAAGAPTTGNGIQVIRVGGTSAANNFVQPGWLVAGAYQYFLTHVPNYNVANDDGYFLQSAARDELTGHAALLSAGQNLIRGCFRDEQRIPDSPKGATYGRAWFGYRQGNSSFGADTGVEQDQDFSCTTGGMDWRMGAGWFGGVSGGFGSSTSDFIATAGPAKLDGDARVIEAYAAFTSSAFFLNISAGYADMDWMYNGTLAGSSNEASSGGFIGSAQAGVGLGLEPLAVKLIGTVSYDGTNCGDTCFGFRVTEDTGLIEAKGALRFDGVTWGGSIRPWAQVAYSTVLSDGVNTVTGGVNTVVSDTNDELLSLDAGMQAYLDENLALYLDGGYNESLGKDISGYRAGIGAKLYW